MTQTENPNDTDTATLASGPLTDAHRPVLPTLLFVFVVTVAAQLLGLTFGRVDEARRLATILLPSLVFLGFVTLPTAGLGLALGRQIGLGTPLLDALLARRPGALRRLAGDAALASVLGLVLGGSLLLVRAISAPYLPPELPSFGHRGVLGGLSVSVAAAVAEEVWFRLGLTTVLIWCVARLAGHRDVRAVVAWPVIAVTSIAFGVAHLPQLMSYGAGSPVAVGATIAGNCAVGVLYGWCYWRRSFVAAVVAHFSVDVALHVVPALFR